MSNSLLYFTQGIRNCQHVSFKFVDSVVYETIQMREHLCPLCHKASKNFYFYRQRQVIGVPIGTKPLVIKFAVHRVYCDKCRKLNVEEIPFLSHPKRRITRALERTLTELRSSASIAALSYYFGVDWETVKNVEKEHLRREYRHIPIKDVESIGIDEIFVGRNPGGGQKYLTVVRDLKSGAVLHVGDGRGVEAMKGFEHKLRHSKADIKYICELPVIFYTQNI